MGQDQASRTPRRASTHFEGCQNTMRRSGADCAQCVGSSRLGRARCNSSIAFPIRSQTASPSISPEARHSSALMAASVSAASPYCLISSLAERSMSRSEVTDTSSHAGRRGRAFQYALFAINSERPCLAVQSRTPPSLCRQSGRWGGLFQPSRSRGGWISSSKPIFVGREVFVFGAGRGIPC